MKKGDIFWLAVIFYLLYLFSQKYNKENKIDKALKKRVRMKNADYIDELNIAVRGKFVSFIQDIQALGYTVVITDGYRSFQRQAYFKNLDRRNATPGFSSHNYGTALDLVLVKDGKIYAEKNTPLATWNATGVPALAKNKYGMRWGGDFWGYPDAVHFDYNNVYDTKKLYAMAIQRWGSPDKVIGNELNLL